MGKCECGCGREARIADRTHSKYGHVKGQPLRFINGHHARGRFGPLNHNWKSGMYLSNGYVMVLTPGHSRGTARRYVLAHILIAEKALGRPLPKGAVVHHANEKKDDNRNQNLVICENQTYHKLLHTRMKERAEANGG